MKHLAQRGIPVPDPQASALTTVRQGKSEVLSGGQILHRLKDKPAAVVNRLRGSSELSPQAHHCAALGDVLARMHLAGRDFEMHQPNLRGLAWWNETVPVVLPYLSAAQKVAHPGRAGLPKSCRFASGLPQPAARSHSCRPVSRQRHVRGERRQCSAVRAVRFFTSRAAMPGCLTWPFA